MRLTPFSFNFAQDLSQVAECLSRGEILRVKSGRSGEYLEVSPPTFWDRLRRWVGLWRWKPRSQQRKHIQRVFNAMIHRQSPESLRQLRGLNVQKSPFLSLLLTTAVESRFDNLIKNVLQWEGQGIHLREQVRQLEVERGRCKLDLEDLKKEKSSPVAPQASSLFPLQVIPSTADDQESPLLARISSIRYDRESADLVLVSSSGERSPAHKLFLKSVPYIGSYLEWANCASNSDRSSKGGLDQRQLGSLDQEELEKEISFEGMPFATSRAVKQLLDYQYQARLDLLDLQEWENLYQLADFLLHDELKDLLSKQLVELACSQSKDSTKLAECLARALLSRDLKLQATAYGLLTWRMVSDPLSIQRVVELLKKLAVHPPRQCTFLLEFLIKCREHLIASEIDELPALLLSGYGSNYPDAQADLNYISGVYALHGLGRGINLDDARRQLEEAADLGQCEALYQLCCFPGKSCQPESELISEYERAARLGSARAGHRLGFYHSQRSYLGEGLGSDEYQQALFWYRQAAALGWAPAMQALGHIYYRKGHYREASLSYHQAVDLGHIPAMKDLAELYEKGQGVEKDQDLARHWLRRAVLLTGTG